MIERIASAFHALTPPAATLRLAASQRRLTEHPLRPELAIAHASGVTRSTVNFGVTFEGPPGCVHGGFVAHFFDQILGQHGCGRASPR